MRPPGTGELLFILVLCVVVFSASKVNQMGDALGAFWRNLQRGAKSDPRITVRPSEPDETDKTA
jgi:Sec-independent protein translocase protein TatA